MANLKSPELKQHDENHGAFCPLCGTPMKESARLEDKGVSHVWFECGRLSCSGWVTQKVTSLYHPLAGRISFTSRV